MLPIEKQRTASLPPRSEFELLVGPVATEARTVDGKQTEVSGFRLAKPRGSEGERPLTFSDLSVGVVCAVLLRTRDERLQSRSSGLSFGDVLPKRVEEEGKETIKSLAQDAESRREIGKDALHPVCRATDLDELNSELDGSVCLASIEQVTSDRSSFSDVLGKVEIEMAELSWPGADRRRGKELKAIQEGKMSAEV
jgi:hypothetical protein